MIKIFLNTTTPFGVFFFVLTLQHADKNQHIKKQFDKSVRTITWRCDNCMQGSQMQSVNVL